MKAECFPGIRTEQLHRVLDNRDLGTPDTVIIHIGTNDLKRSVNLDYVIGEVHDGKFLFSSHTVFLFLRDTILNVLCFSKQQALLKCLLHASHGILVPVATHGGLVIQSLHVLSHLCATSRLHPLLQAVQTYRLWRVLVQCSVV
jgi:hypothetical protein